VTVLRHVRTVVLHTLFRLTSSVTHLLVGTVA